MTTFQLLALFDKRFYMASGFCWRTLYIKAEIQLRARLGRSPGGLFPGKPNYKPPQGKQALCVCVCVCVCVCECTQSIWRLRVLVMLHGRLINLEKQNSCLEWFFNISCGDFSWTVDSFDQISFQFHFIDKFKTWNVEYVFIIIYKLPSLYQFEKKIEIKTIHIYIMHLWQCLKKCLLSPNLHLKQFFQLCIIS